MPQVETQFFLSSEVAEEVNEGRTRFSVTLEPPMKLEGKSARLFVHSASVPYTTRNITSANNSMIVDVGPGTTTVSIDPGVYSLQDMEAALNSAVNAYMHNSGLALLTDGSGKANFVTFTPNSKLNRVEATFAHIGTGMDCSKAASTMRDVLGFDSLIGYAEPIITVSNEQPLSIGITYIYGGGSPSSYTHNIPNGAYTVSTLTAALDAELASQNYYMTVGVCTMSTAPSEYVAGEFTGSYAYNATSNTYAFFTAGQDAVIQSVFGGAGVHRRASRWSGEGPTHVAALAANVDAVTEIGVALPGITHGAYSTAGDSTNIVARFPVTGTPGDLIVFAPDVPLFSDVSHLLGTAVSTVVVQLTDQHGAELEVGQRDAFWQRHRPSPSPHHTARPSPSPRTLTPQVPSP
eukprot:COSAG04_NODE_919_length_9421_cov_5.695130_12_plen_405_part_01